MTFASLDHELLDTPSPDELLLEGRDKDLEFGCPRCKVLPEKWCRLDTRALAVGRVHIERRNEHDIGF